MDYEWSRQPVVQSLQQYHPCCTQLITLVPPTYRECRAVEVTLPSLTNSKCYYTKQSLTDFIEIFASAKRQPYSNTSKGQGEAMVQRSCSNGHAICKELCSSPTYNQRSSSPVIKFLHSTIKTQRQHLCCLPIPYSQRCTKNRVRSRISIYGLKPCTVLLRQ